MAGVETSQALFSVMNRFCNLLHFSTTNDAPNKMRFFTKVCVLLRIKASPKHPQSVTALLTASHSVTTVITAMNVVVQMATNRRFNPISRHTHRENSMNERATDSTSVTHPLKPFSPTAA